MYFFSIGVRCKRNLLSEHKGSTNDVKGRRILCIGSTVGFKYQWY